MPSEQPPGDEARAAPEPAGQVRPLNEDPNTADTFGHTIPPPPRGWTAEEWRKSFLGDGNQAQRRLGQSGAGWLLPAILAAVVLVLVVLLIVVR
ncbi:MAG TPA: hypothetical protein VGP46_04345 [Acidimicrobiales bacterium]|nr:hypothetical protein [Acidimicrobiales bacterium]